MTYARGGLIQGPDETPIYTQTMWALARNDGYVIPASTVKKMGVNLLAALNAAELPT